ncbi:MAG: DUF5330 domain-containing protein [Nitratireductor sp.]|nr:DUF5330 domain-containing protein [Nitratireductor sp.]
MFLFRAIFWLGLIAAVIPVNPADLPDGQRQVSALETVGLARSIASDAAGFCGRNPASCETGHLLISQIGIKAKEGARLAYTWLDQRYGNEAGAGETAQAAGPTIDPVSTGTVN